YRAWPNLRGGARLKTEAAPLAPTPPAAQRESLAAIEYVERVVPAAAPLRGIVLRYGAFYGPGASDSLVGLIRKRRLPIIGDGAGGWSFLHISDAASATLAALEHGRPGGYHVVADRPDRGTEWLPCRARAVGAKPPLRVPVWLGRLAAGEVAVSAMTRIRGSSNARAKRELGWQPAWPSWREGFSRGLSDTEPAHGAA